MSLIRKLKIKKQRLSGLFLQTSLPKVPDTIQALINPLPKQNEPPTLTTASKDSNDKVSYSENDKIVDGYWIVIQEWTQCSLKCGGGTSTLQRMCIPPKNAGKNCYGSSIVNKPCNIQPCPEVKILRKALKSNETMKDPIVKIVSFSNRPQRYTVCNLFYLF